MVRIMRSKSIVSLCVAIAVIGVTACGPSTSSTETGAVVASSIEANQISVFDIEGMTCVTCPATVKKAMSRVEGVVSVDVDFKARQATVGFDDRVVDVSTISDASTAVGFPAFLREPAK